MPPLSQQLKGAAGGLWLVILLTGYKTSPLCLCLGSCCFPLTQQPWFRSVGRGSTPMCCRFLICFANDTDGSRSQGSIFLCGMSSVNSLLGAA